MPKSNETDPLRKWMKEKGVWQLDLCKMLENQDVSSLSDFQALPKDTVLEIIDSAKKTGFMHSSKLKELHGGFPKKKKKKDKPKAKPAENKPKRKDPADLKREARPRLEPWMRDNGIWQIDLFDLITEKYEIYSPDEFEEYKEDPDWVDDFLLDAKQVGVMGNQATTLAVFCGKQKAKKKKKKKDNAKPAQPKPKQKDHEEMKIEARPVLEKYLRDNNVWQIDLFDMMVDKYNIYTVEDFLEYKEDEDWVDEFLYEAKHVGVMGQKVKYLEKLCGRRKNVNAQKKKKKAAPKAPAKPKEKKLSPEEIENKARAKMEPFMQDKGFWHKDLFLILLGWDVHEPSDLNNLSKSDRKEIVQEAKQKGLIGQKVKNFKAYFQ
mmetsp:Transcript_14549/g.22763  ORF Transcript_14549/g.22763 Transcript_14549/m.22763 type:complete len:377 (+) Transcript_14549:47-1177(+)